MRKFVLATHLSLSVGWIGSVVAYLVLSVAAAVTRDVETITSSWVAMELVGWYAIVPIALGSLVTGILIALGTSWGLFRHYWVVISLVLTTFAAIVLLLHMPDVSALADVARGASEGELAEHQYSRLGEGDLLHPGLGLVVLLVIQFLNVYKPPGLTPYGFRKWRREGDLTPS